MRLSSRYDRTKMLNQEECYIKGFVPMGTQNTFKIERDGDKRKEYIQGNNCGVH